MPTLRAFRGLRYDLGHVGSLSDVIAPPYDVIDSALQDELYKRHPCNVIRLELNRSEPGDDEHNNVYFRASQFLKNWKSEGVLQHEPDPAIYVYHQVFSWEGKSFVRRGFMAAMKLERFGEGKVFPHEQTHAAAKEDRLKLTRATRTNLSQIFGLYPDPAGEAQQILEAAIVGKTAHEATDHLGVLHRMWPISDSRTISRVAAVLEAKPMFVADGHHRYETACNYRDELGKKSPLDANHPANFVLTMCIGMEDPGLVVLPTHRLFRGVAPMDSDALQAKLRPYFTTRIFGEGCDLAGEVWQEVESEGAQDAMAFYTAEDQRWVVARITPEGRRKMAEITQDQSEQWQSLGVSLLHRLVMENLLGLTNLPKPMYVHSIDEVVQGLEKGDAVGRDATGQEGQGSRFELAALVMPATVEDVRKISEAGERMPQKSTYFYPKLLSGMVFHSLETT